MISSRGTLRRLSSSPGIQGCDDLRDAIMEMRKYLKLLVKEYHKNYLPLAHQQRLDEAALTSHINKLTRHDDGPFPLLPADLMGPLPAESALQDPARFRLLQGLREKFYATPFRAAYEAAKPLMQRNAGIVVDNPRSPSKSDSSGTP